MCDMTRTEASKATDISSDSATRTGNYSGAAIIDPEGQTPSQFRKRVREQFPNLVLADNEVEEWRGMEALEILCREGRHIPMISHNLGQQEESTRSALDKKMKELARSNGELEQFASVASHDLQEPLRMISTYTQMLAAEYSGKLDEKADKYIHYVVDAAVRMQSLIRDLLEFSRTGRGESGLMSTDSAEEVRLVVSNLQAAIHESAAIVTCGPLPIVMAHPFQLRQVFQNLIGNAIKFHDGQPPAIQVDAERKDGEWLFSVTDNGISIAPENAQKIFAIFQRLHTREEYPGNGIGLAICRKIIEQHGGRIWVEPRAIEGAVFKFTWPSSIL
jgi:two-component system, chemotaxis family, sensor kinase Cph1